MSVAARDGRVRGNLSSSALDARGGISVPDGHAEARGSGDRCACPKCVEERAGPRDRRSARASAARVPSVLGKDALLDFHVEMTLGEERLTAAEIRGVTQRVRWLAVPAGPMGGGGPRETFAIARAIPRRRGGRFGRRTCPSQRRCGWSPVSRWMTRRGLARRRIPTGRRLRRARGSQRRCEACAVPRVWPVSIPDPRYARPCGPTNRLVCAGCICCTAWGLALASPTTWEWVRRSRSCHCFWCCKQEFTRERRPPGTASSSILVAPASLLANWAAEVERFAPTLEDAHRPSLVDVRGAASSRWRPRALANVDLVITSYGALLRYDWLTSTVGRSPSSMRRRPSRIRAPSRPVRSRSSSPGPAIALTGTPVENRLSDLWSIFDFTHPGLLGSGQAFAKYVRRLAEAGKLRAAA